MKNEQFFMPTRLSNIDIIYPLILNKPTRLNPAGYGGIFMIKLAGE